MKGGSFAYIKAQFSKYFEDKKVDPDTGNFIYKWRLEESPVFDAANIIALRNVETQRHFSSFYFFVRIIQKENEVLVSMDDLDHKILQLLAENARMPVKDIAQRVSLTSPAVSSRIHRLEQEGIIGGYTVVLRNPGAPARVEALISVLVEIGRAHV